jgi:AhpD family alkylhydroperoxidase
MDPEHLKKAAKFMKESKSVAEEYEKWHKAVFDEKKSPLDAKTMELIALGASSVIRCSYCIESHGMKAKKYGASAEEIAKAVQIAAVVGAGSTISYGLEALDVDGK